MKDAEDWSDVAASRLLNPQGLLYHYTGQQGLLGIIDTGKIWASHIRYLNDTKEYLAGRSFVERIVRLMREQEHADEETVKAVDATLEMLDGFDIYAASLSKADDGDSLGMWRAYALTPPGYSIGISAESLKTALQTARALEPVGRPQLTGLYGVQYVPELGEDYQIRTDLIWLPQLFREIVLRFKATNLEPFLNKGLPILDLAFKMMHSFEERARYDLLLAHLLPLLKHEGFSAEQEHRIVQVRMPDNDFEHCTDLGFHAGRSSIIPHVEIGLPAGDFGIHRIVVGPCPDPSWAVRAVEMLLTKNKIKIRRGGDEMGVEVVSSKIPYRNW